ncbi:MAG: hypothetical protein ABJE95_06125 [Byssovorax sp.]
MKKIEWMIAAGTAAALAGAVVSAGCVNTAGDCTLLGTACGSGGGSTSTTATATSTTASGATTSTASVSASASSSSGTGGADALSACEANRFGDAKDQAAQSVIVGSSGDILLAGDLHGSLNIGLQMTTAKGLDDLFLARLGANQQAKWIKSFPVSYGAVARDAAGGIVVAGSYVNAADFGAPCAPLDGTNNFYLARLDIDGTCQWAKGFALSSPDVHSSLAVAANGHIALVGDTVGPMDFHTSGGGPIPILGNNPGKRDIFAVELDSGGQIISPTPVGFGGPDDDVVNGVAFDAAGGMVLVGAFKSASIDFGSNAFANASGQDRAFLAGIGGVKNWHLDFPGGKGATDAQSAGAVVFANGLAIAAGDYTGALGALTSTGHAFFLVAADPATGKQIWAHPFDGKAGVKSIKAIAAGADGALAWTGALTGDVDFGSGPVASNGGAIVATFKADGTPVSSLAFGDTTSLPAVRGISYQGASVFVAGSFAAKLAFDKTLSIDSAGGTDAFLANLSKLCP